MTAWITSPYRASWPVLCLLAVLAICRTAAAQDSSTPADATETSDESPAADVEAQSVSYRQQLETLLKELDAATELEPEVRTTIRDELGAADKALTDAEEPLTRARSFSQRSAEEFADLQSRIDEIQEQGPPDVPGEATLAELQQAATDLRKSLEELQQQQQRLDDRPARREVLDDQLSTLPAEMSDLSEQLPGGDDKDLLTRAQELSIECRILTAETELLAARAEIAFYDAEAPYAWVRGQWLRQQILRKTEEIRAYDSAILQLGEDEARQRAGELRQELESASSAGVRNIIEGPLTIRAEERLQGSLPLVLEEIAVRGNLASLAPELESITQERDQVSNWLDQANERVNTTGPTQALGLRLRQQRERLADLVQVRLRKSERLVTIEEAQNSLLDYSDQLDEWANTNSLVDEIAASSSIPDNDEELRKAVNTRRLCLTKLVEAYSSYVDALDALDMADSSLIDRTGEFTDFMDERIFWIRSHKPLSLESFANDERTFQWIRDGAAFSGVWKAMSSDVRRHPVLWSVILALLVALFVRASFLRRELHERARIAQGRVTTFMKPTLEAWLITVVLSIPWPALILSFAWRLQVSSESTELATLSTGLLHLGLVCFVLEFFRQVCRPSGLADAHFSWPDRTVILLRRTFQGLIVCALPAAAVAILLHAHELGPGLESDAYEMAAFAAMMLIPLYFMHHLLKPSNGVLREWVADHKGGWVQLLQYPIYAAGLVLFALPAALTVLGYYYTAQQLLLKTEMTLWLILSLLFVQAMLFRSITLRRRRMALDQLQQRRAAAEKEAAATGEGGRSGVPVVSLEMQPDLGQVSRQTERMLNTTLVVCGLATLWGIGIDAIPTLNYLRQWTLWEDSTITYVDLAAAVLLATLTITAARNVPGFLEITILRRLPLDPSTRYATTTITRYLIVVVGVMLVSRTFGISWAQVQWLVTGLTVGLAFGLQEIVANFVSGIIILFEQPVRVGDVVTIDDVSGVVSRIRIRSTTITAWDRKEYVVPNRDFITGRLLNWTLSDTTNRVVVNVGVAYGSDTNKVYEIISRVAAEHPRILDEPATSVTFESFGDSALDFVLRAYLPNLDHRLTTISELHAAIHNELTRAGIEIPFPQRDLHVKSLPADLDQALARPDEQYQHGG